MKQKTFVTVWSYKCTNLFGLYAPLDVTWRTVCFLFGSIEYRGDWLGPSDSVMMVSQLYDWEC